MSVPLLDLNLKALIDFTLKEILKDPDTVLREIFGDAKLEPHAALYGDQFIEEVKTWFTTTRIAVVLGYDLDPTQIPGVTVQLQAANPTQSYLGDLGMTYSQPLQEREILVQKFSPALITSDPGGGFIQLGLPNSLTDDQKQLVTPGLRIRDKNGREYGIGEDKGFPTAIEITQDQLKDADLSEIEIISPITDATFRQGVMTYDEMALITVHGHANRVEGLWLWAIVHYGLLKYRPILTSVFGLDLGLPAATDFTKDDSYLGENVWRRFISLSVKTNWSWTSYRQQDAVAFILNMKASMNTLFQRASNSRPDPIPETDL